MYLKHGMLLIASALAISVLAGTESPWGLPCRFSDQLLKNRDGKIVQLTSAEMKARARHKTDIAGPVTQLDIRVTVLVSMVVGVKGEVVCLKTVAGHELVQQAVEEALRRWRFKPAKMDGKPVAYLGWLEFTLCNLGCGKRGRSMTLLK